MGGTEHLFANPAGACYIARDMTESLKPRQRQILDFLRDHAERHGYPPTVREIGRAVGLSSASTVQNHLNSLETKGFIKRDPAKSRTVEVVGSPSSPKHGPNVFQLPLIGRVAAGSPVLAEQNIDQYIGVGPEIGGAGDTYCLTVHGDSMIDAGIFDGDMVVVKPRKDAPPDGTIVVARIENPTTGEGEVTVKRFFKESGRVRLQPENSALEPIYVRDVAIEGAVVAVIRLLN